MGSEVAPNKRAVLKMIERVRGVVQSEISGHAGQGKVAAGLSSEGLAGGYLAALHDVEAVLRHGCPSDHRGYWRRAALPQEKQE